MKRRSFLRLIPLSLLPLAFASCQDELKQPDSFEYYCQVHAKISKDEVSKVQQYLDSDPYFKATTSYSGSFDECHKQAVADFQKHCDAIDETYLRSLLHAEGEYVQISLYMKGGSVATMSKAIKY